MYLPEVTCDVCETWIRGPISSYLDLQVCAECYAHLKAEQEAARARELRDIKLPWHVLLGVLAACWTAVFLVDSWPLVDGVAAIGAGASTGLLAFKVYGKVRG